MNFYVSLDGINVLVNYYDGSLQRQWLYDSQYIRPTGGNVTITSYGYDPGYYEPVSYPSSTLAGDKTIYCSATLVRAAAGYSYAYSGTESYPYRADMHFNATVYGQGTWYMELYSGGVRVANTSQYFSSNGTMYLDYVDNLWYTGSAHILTMYVSMAYAGKVYSQEFTYRGQSAPAAHTITYNPNGGVSGSVTSQSTTYPPYNTNIVLSPQAIPTRSGYTFDGFSATRTGTVLPGLSREDFAASRVYSLTVDRTVYAKWSPKVYDTFYWTGTSAGDNAVFISQKTTWNPSVGIANALTAARWNRMLTLIGDLAYDKRGARWYGTSVSPGGSIRAVNFNEVRSELVSLGATTVPDPVSVGDILVPGMFIGARSLRGAVNEIIESI